MPPYVDEDIRNDLDMEINALLRSWRDRAGCNPGALNYIISRLLGAAFKHDPAYRTINGLVGAVTCATLEFYRRVAAPHEGLAKQRNGDVY
jgi:hypothetical protein